MTKIIITGGTGFLGSHLFRELGRKRLFESAKDEIYPSKDWQIYALGSNHYDLISMAQTQAMYQDLAPDIVFHLAATVGGIGANRNHPAKFFYDNMQMGMNVIHQAHLYEVKKIIVVGTTCSYPKFAHIPFSEVELYDGYPEETNAPYGIAKRALLTMLNAYHDEYGLNFNYLIPTNIYGPGDNFNNSTSHVIPALIKKCLGGIDEINPKERTITIWGTGRPTRDFVYVTDVAKALVMAMENYERAEPLNIGSGQEVMISTLLHFIVQKTGFCGKIEYDNSKPDGQPRRALSTREIKQAFAWEPLVSLQDGLQETINWYKDNYE